MNPRKPENGFILITVLLFLFLISGSAFLSMEQSQLSYKVNQLRVANDQALFLSDYARERVLNNLQGYLTDKILNSETTEQLLIQFQEKEGRARVFATVFPPEASYRGNSMLQHQPYSGNGIGMAGSGGISQLIELRAEGEVAHLGGAVSRTTASDLRIWLH